MCNCIQEMQDRIRANSGKKVVCQNHALFYESEKRPDEYEAGESIPGRYVNKAFLLFKVPRSRKKDDTIKIVLSKCPLCGEAY